MAHRCIHDGELHAPLRGTPRTSSGRRGLDDGGAPDRSALAAALGEKGAGGTEGVPVEDLKHQTLQDANRGTRARPIPGRAGVRTILRDFPSAYGGRDRVGRQGTLRLRQAGPRGPPDGHVGVQAGSGLPLPLRGEGQGGGSMNNWGVDEKSAVRCLTPGDRKGLQLRFFSRSHVRRNQPGPGNFGPGL